MKGISWENKNICFLKNINYLKYYLIVANTNYKKLKESLIKIIISKNQMFDIKVN